MKQKSYICLILLVVICIFPINIQGKERKTIKVGYIDYAGFIEKTDNNEYSGYGIDYLEEISKYTSWNYEFIYDTWENCLQKLEDGEIDLLCSAQYTKERDGKYDFSKYSCGKEFSVLYVNSDNKTFYYNDLQAFNNSTIGLLTGSFQNEAFAEYAHKMGFKYNIKEYNTDSEMINALQQGEIDAMVAGSLSRRDNLRVVAKFSVDPFYFMVKKGNNELLEPLNDAMAQIQCNNPYFEMQLYDKYYSRSVTSNQPLFTKSEVAYINEAPILRVAYLKGWYPYSYYSEHGEEAGALIQLCHRIEEQSGLKFTFVPYDSIDDIYQSMDDGKIDIVAVMPNIKQHVSDKEIRITSPYLISQVMLLSTNQYINQTKDLNLVAVKSMKHLSDYFYKQFHVRNIYWEDTLEDCIDGVEKKTADFAVVDYFNVNKAVHIGEDDKILVSQTANARIEIALGVASDEDGQLIEILNKCIQFFSDKDYYGAINMELTAQESVFSLKAFLREYSTIILVIVLLALLAIAVLIVILRRIFKRIIAFDKLTGCHNQSHFEKLVPRILDEHENIEYYIMSFDIYRFKYFIQYYGKKAGDDLVRSITSKVRILLGKEEIIARTSDDSFAILIESTNYLKIIEEFYFLLDEIKQNFKVDISIKVNFGLYKIEDKKEPVAMMVDKAILAQRTVRDKKNLAYAIYTNEMEEKLLLETRIEEEMKRALKKREFQVVYQPKVDIKTKKVVGAEALIRWIKADGTMIYPDQFIPIFERNGFIEQLDYYVLNEVSKYITDRIEKNLPTFPISVNQSRYLFTNPRYADNIITIINVRGVPAELIELEITETMYMENNTLIERVIKRLKECNIRFAIDDFGSGYSSLTLLTEMETDVLKIDREFLTDSDKSQEKKDVIEKVVELAHKLNLQVVCEGVETKEQEEFLESISCDVAQGYYYSKPISVKKFDLYVEKNI
jgi:diguanylate cyclase (GGDEF)-like protein